MTNARRGWAAHVVKSSHLIHERATINLGLFDPHPSGDEAESGLCTCWSNHTLKLVLSQLHFFKFCKLNIFAIFKNLFFSCIWVSTGPHVCTVFLVQPKHTHTHRSCFSYPCVNIPLWHILRSFEATPAVTTQQIIAFYGNSFHLYECAQALARYWSSCCSACLILWNISHTIKCQQLMSTTMCACEMKAVCARCLLNTQRFMISW